MKKKIYKNFAEDITTFMVNTLISTMDIVMNPWKKKEPPSSAKNPATT